MEEFTEKHHAFIAASFYKELVENYGKQGEKAFIMAVQRYAEQRGSRMAQRAIRDNKELTFAVYREYGEWISSETLKNEGAVNIVEEVAFSPDYEIKILQCPWAEQFKKMNLTKAGIIYCTHLDKAIVRGFNPYLVFEVPQSIYEHEYCIQIMREANFKKNQEIIKNNENIKKFDYHCGHCYKTFKDITISIFKIKGEKIALKVLKDFSKDYANEMAEILISYLKVDFNLI
ncbi:L-2-amino-thiazoline-4-carboxylic acid hydrolase [Fusobacterium varium]